MDKRYQDQVVMITGAASGFGRLAAERFADEGAKLALSDISAEGLAEAAEAFHAGGTQVVADVVDVADEAQVAAHVSHTVDALGGLDVAVNNAGMGHEMKRVHHLTVEDWDRTMDVNAKGVFLCMKHQLPVMLAAGKGAILNVASAAGLLGAGQLGAYAAAKHAVVGLTRAAADETARKGVRVNAICPSFSSTPLFDQMADAVSERTGASREQAYSHIASRVPMARVSEPAEVVQAMLWICSPENSFMTGQAIAIDGGLTAV